MSAREDYIQHIINTLMPPDIDYARWALSNYNQMLPDLKLIDGVRDALRGVK